MKLRLIPTRPHVGSLLPSFGTKESACFDICADIIELHIKVMSPDGIPITVYSNRLDDPFCLAPGYRALIPTGFIFVIPHGYSMRLHSRSGHGWKYGVHLMNGTGIIDSDYPNETFVMLVNTSSEPLFITHGDKIAQAELIKTTPVDFEILPLGSNFPNTTDRVGGFGSTS